MASAKNSNAFAVGTVRHFVCVPRTWDFAQVSEEAAQPPRSPDEERVFGISVLQPSSGEHYDGAAAAAEATVAAAVKFPPASQAASKGKPPNRLNTHIHARAGSHARTHIALTQPGNIFRCSFLHLHRCCFSLTRSAPAMARRREGGREASIGNYSIRLSHSYLRPSVSVRRRRRSPAPATPASHPHSRSAIYVTRPATDSVTWSATEGSLPPSLRPSLFSVKLPTASS